jgi:thymidylate kinase
MIVICLEGCHGSGKSSLIKQFKDRGYQVLDEAFIDMPSTCLHPQTITMETVWLANWMTRLLRIKDSDDASEVYIADRSPYSAVYYAPHGELLRPIIDAQVAELRDKAGIDIRTVHVRVAADVLWDRILKRLEAEPHRHAFNEHRREWMDRTQSWYDQQAWDFTVENSDVAIDDLAHALLRSLGRLVTGFKIASPLAARHVFDAPCSGKGISMEVARILSQVE